MKIYFKNCKKRIELLIGPEEPSYWTRLVTKKNCLFCLN